MVKLVWFRSVFFVFVGARAHTPRFAKRAVYRTLPRGRSGDLNVCRSLFTIDDTAVFILTAKSSGRIPTLI